MINKYQKLAIKTLDKLQDIYHAFPVSEQKQRVLVDIWGQAFEVNRIDPKMASRGIYWAMRDKSRNLCALGQFIEWSGIKTDQERKQEMIDQINQKALPAPDNSKAVECGKNILKCLKSEILKGGR